jgi:hypothetical protein
VKCNKKTYSDKDILIPTCEDEDMNPILGRDAVSVKIRIGMRLPWLRVTNSTRNVRALQLFQELANTGLGGVVRFFSNLTTINLNHMAVTDIDYEGMTFEVTIIVRAQHHAEYIIAKIYASFIENELGKYLGHFDFTTLPSSPCVNSTQLHDQGRKFQNATFVPISITATRITNYSREEHLKATVYREPYDIMRDREIMKDYPLPPAPQKDGIDLRCGRPKKALDPITIPALSRAKLISSEVGIPDQDAPITIPQTMTPSTQTLGVPDNLKLGPERDQLLADEIAKLKQADALLAEKESLILEKLRDLETSQ